MNAAEHPSQAKEQSTDAAEKPDQAEADFGEAPEADKPMGLYRSWS